MQVGGVIYLIFKNMSLLFLGNIGAGEIIVIALVVLLLFGGKKIPELMKKFNGELSIKADTSNPCFVYERKGKNKKDKSSDALSVVKNVLIEMKGLLEP